MKLLIQNGHLIDPAENQNSGKDLLTEDGKVVGSLKDYVAVPLIGNDVPPGSLVVGYAARVVKQLDASTGEWREVSTG